MSFFLLLIIAAFVLGIVGVVIKGLLWLFAIGIAVGIAGLVGLGWNTGRRSHTTRL